MRTWANGRKNRSTELADTSVSVSPPLISGNRAFRVVWAGIVGISAAQDASRFPISWERRAENGILESGESYSSWGSSVAQSTVAKYMVKHRRPPTQSWATFLRNHADGIAGTDLLVVPTIDFRLLYCLIVLGHGRRRLVHYAVTAHPTDEWIARQIVEAFPWDEAPTYLVRDRDAIYGAVVKRRLRGLGIRDRPITPRSPWQNGHVERLIGSIRRECLDHMIVLGGSHLRRIMKNYVTYYNAARTHLALDKDAPIRRPIERMGCIIAQPDGRWTTSQIRSNLIFSRDRYIQTNRSRSTAHKRIRRGLVRRRTVS